MATPDEIRRRLEEQANKRVNPLLKGLSMLTGGIAGEFTGTNEQIRQQRSAKRTLMAEEAAALSQQRIEEAARLAKEEDLKRQIRAKAAEDEARLLEETRKARGAEMALKGEDMVGPLDPATMAGMAAAKAAQSKVEAERMNALRGRGTAMRGYLAGRNVQLGDPDLETVEFLEAQEKTKEAAEKEARLTKAGYMSFYIPGLGQISGTPDNIEETKKKYPQYKTIIENAVKQAESGEALFTPTVEEDPVTGYRRRKLVFKPGTPISVMKAAEEEYFGKQKGAFDGEPSAGIPATKATQPTSIPGYNVRLKQ